MHRSKVEGERFDESNHHRVILLYQINVRLWTDRMTASRKKYINRTLLHCRFVFYRLFKKCIIVSISYFSIYFETGSVMLY